MRLLVLSGVVMAALAVAFWQWPSAPPSPPRASTEQESTVASEPANSEVNAPQPEPAPESTPTRDTKLSASAREARTKSNPTKNADPRLAQLNADYPSLDMRLHEMQSRRQGGDYDPDAVEQAVLEPTAWKNSEAPGSDLDLTDEEKQDGREFIQFNRLKLETLVSGDTLDIPIAQTGQTYQAKITHSEVNNDGSVTWHGQLHDELGPLNNDSGKPYEVTFTSGNTMVSGGIFTPDGHFVLESANEQGWIGNASTLFKFDENEPDFIIPGAEDEHDH